LNVAVRQELKAIGTVAPEDHTFRVLVQRQDMTGAERSWASHYEIDDVVRYTRGSKAIGIESAAYASVVAINPASNQLTVERANKELATYDPRRLTGVSVYREIDRQFSVGDRVQFTAPDKSPDVANCDLAVIESIAPDGQITARLDNNRQIEFHASEHRHFDHGYAVTSHSAQGLTAERVLVHADTSVHPDLLNSRFGYVSSPAPATRPRSSPTTWQNSCRCSEPMSRRPLLWKSVRRHPSHRELGLASNTVSQSSNYLEDLTRQFGRGFGRGNVGQMRRVLTRLPETSPLSPKSNLRKTPQCRGREPLVLRWVRNARRAPMVSTAGCYIGAQPTRAVHLLRRRIEM